MDTTVAVTGKGSYCSSAKAAFRITKAKALARNVTVDFDEKAKVSAMMKVEYEKVNKAGGEKDGRR